MSIVGARQLPEDAPAAVAALREAPPAPDPIRGARMLVATRPLVLLDHFRTPYRVRDERTCEATEELRLDGGGPALLWPRHTEHLAPAMATVTGGDRLEVPVFARVISDRDARPLLAGHGDGWTAARELVGEDRRPLGSIWRSDDGSVFIPFDPDEVIVNAWSERYVAIAQGAASRSSRRMLMRSYYRIRPLLPRALQIWVRRRFAAVQARARFPRWPAETSLHDFFDLAFTLLAKVAGRPIPRIAPWPDDHRWALVLTHDVEQAGGWAAIDPVVELERAHGMRSSFNLVPRRYEIEHERVQRLVEDGFEVGVHGLYHDGRDLESPTTLRERLPGMRTAAVSWGAVGFRSPATHRNWELMPTLAFDYDSSSPDTDPFEPQGGGCCTWLPFFNQEMVELPLTMPQDHTLFVILGHQDERAWVRKGELLRARGGMALIDTHPDYLVQERIMRAYCRFLTHFADDQSAWKALPREVSAWWRMRAASRLEPDGDGWRIVGPASEAGRVELFAAHGRHRLGADGASSDTARIFSLSR